MKQLLPAIVSLVLVTGWHGRLSAEPLQIPDDAQIIAEAVLTDPDILPVVVQDQALNAAVRKRFIRTVANVSDLENDPAMFFLTHLHLTDVKVSRSLRAEFSAMNGMAVLIAGEAGEFVSVYDGDESDLPPHVPPLLTNGGKYYLLFLSKVKAPSDMGRRETERTMQHYNTLKQSGVLTGDLYTIFRQQAGFQLDDLAGTSIPLTEDIVYLFGPLRNRLLNSTPLTADELQQLGSAPTTDIGKKVAQILLSRWKPVATSTPTPLPTPVPRPSRATRPPRLIAPAQ